MYLLLCIIFTLFNYLDYRTTFIILNNDGIECNIFVDKIIIKYGFKGFFIFKLIMNIIIVLSFSHTVLISLIIIYFIILINNFFQIFKMDLKLNHKDLYCPFY